MNIKSNPIYLKIILGFAFIWSFILIGESIFNRDVLFEEYYTFYKPAIDKFLENNHNFYDLGYLPSFFFLIFFFYNITIYLVFLFSCATISSFFLFKMEKNKNIALIFSFLMFSNVLIGNIDPFIVLIVVLCLYYKKNDTLTPILLAFITFKLSVLIVVVYFFLISKKKYKFIIIFCSALTIFNWYFLIHYELIFEFIAFGSNLVNLALFVRVWSVYLSYYALKEYQEKMINIIKIDLININD